MATNYLIFFAFLQTTSAIVLTANVSTVPLMYLMTTEALGHRSSHPLWTAMQTTGQENTMLPETSNNVNHEVHEAVHLPRGEHPECQKLHQGNITHSKPVSSNSAHSNNYFLANYPDVDRIRQSFIWAPQTVYEAPFTSKGIVKCVKKHVTGYLYLPATEPYLFKAKYRYV